MPSSVAYWRFVTVVRDPAGATVRAQDRGWGLPRAKAEADLRRKHRKQGDAVVEIVSADGPHWPPGRGPIWYRRGLPMPPEVAARIASVPTPTGPLVIEFRPDDHDGEPKSRHDHASMHQPPGLA